MKLLLGIGTRFRGDDAAGLLVAERAGGAGMESPDAARLLSAWDGVTDLVVIDAVQSGAPPGTIHCFEAARAPLPADLFASGSHAFGLAQAIELGRALERLPERVTVYGIEGKQFGFGETISPEVEAAISELSERISQRENGVGVAPVLPQEVVGVSADERHAGPRLPVVG